MAPQGGIRFETKLDVLWVLMVASLLLTGCPGEADYPRQQRDQLIIRLDGDPNARYDGGSQASCGNGTCEPSESAATCPADCPAAPCGNGTCDAGETTATCPADCSANPCGNGACDAGETTATCPADCSATPCGNGACDAGETTATCPADCPANPCGNGACDAGETTATCPADCPANPCGNGTCDAGETTATCPADCPANPCGNGTCDAGETTATCPADCPQCSGAMTQCAGTDQIKGCKNGRWQTYACAALCTGQGYDYAVGCAFSTAKKSDACLCANYVGFGGICDDQRLCKTGLACGRFTATGKGFCTKTCSTLGATCSGGPAGTFPTCALQNQQGQLVCGFLCSAATPQCPTGMQCDTAAHLCKP